MNLALEAIEKCKHCHFKLSFLQQKVLGRGHSKFEFHFVTLVETIKQVALLSAKKFLRSQTFLLK